MLGRHPRPLLRTSSKSILIPSDGVDGQPAAFCHNSRVSEKHPVIVGFDLGVENKPSDPCESPRSVLDPTVLASPQEKPATARSPRSCLASLLLSGKKGSQGVGLGIIANIQAEEEEEAKGPFFSAVLTVSHGQPISISQNHLQYHGVREHDYGNEVSGFGIANPLPTPTHVKGIGWAHKVSNPKCTDTEWIVPSERQATPFHPFQDIEDDDEINIPQSIFSAVSPPSNCCSFDMWSSTGFLNACFFCRCSLLQGKDIFMYRGDRAFCSAECRYQQIVIDERKERRSVTVGLQF